MTDTVQTNPPAMAAPFRINSDPLDWTHLPKPVRAKHRLLRSAKDDALILMHAASDERKATWEQKREAEARLKTLTGGRADSPWYSHIGDHYQLDDDHPEVAAQLKLLEDTKADIVRLDEIVKTRSELFTQIARLVSHVERFLGDLHRVRGGITLYDGPVPTLQKRESVVDATERCRRRIRELDADRHRVASAPWNATYAKKRARVEIDKLAERGRPSLLPLVETPDGTIAWGERSFNEAIIGGRLISAACDPPATPLLFWVHRDALIQKIEIAIDEIADDENALTAQQRKTQIEEIERDMLAVEREEEYWITSAVSDGTNVLRRSDADPRAILGLGSDMPPPPAD